MSGVRIVCGFCNTELRRGQDCPTCSPPQPERVGTVLERVLSQAAALSHVAPPRDGETPPARLARYLRSSARAHRGQS